MLTATKSQALVHEVNVVRPGRECCCTVTQARRPLELGSHVLPKPGVPHPPRHNPLHHTFRFDGHVRVLYESSFVMHCAINDTPTVPGHDMQKTHQLSTDLAR